LKYLILILVVVLGAGGGIWVANLSADAPAEDSIQTAENVDIEAATQAFQDYARLFNAFDPSFAASYADSAVVHLTVHRASGEVQSVIFPVDKMKANAQQLVDAQRVAGQQYNFMNLHASRSEHGVRIVARLKSTSWRTAYPYKVDLMADSDGVWKIVEEWTEGQLPY